jgi:hypothetical protein
VNATGYATAKKFELQEAQLKTKLKEWKMLDKFDILDFQWVGRPQANPTCQLASTSYLRVFAQAVEKDVVGKLLPAWATNTMQHFSGSCGRDILDGCMLTIDRFPQLAGSADGISEAIHRILSRNHRAERPR